MTPEALATLHARAFEGQGRAWSAQEFGDLLGSPHVFAVTQAFGCLIGRVIADEAEILTLATDPDCRRQGIARTLLHSYEAQALSSGAKLSFLEVAEDNVAAVSLYLTSGYVQTARRADYYHPPNGPPIDALMLRKNLG